MPKFSPQQYKGITYTLTHYSNSGWEVEISDGAKFYGEDYSQIHKRFTEYIDSLIPVEKNDEKQEESDYKELEERYLVIKNY